MRRAHPRTDVRALARTELLILRLLREHAPAYGLRLVALSNGELAEGTVYVTLGRMTEKGYVESWVMRVEELPGPPRRVYRATAHGARMLDAYETYERAVGAKGGA